MGKVTENSNQNSQEQVVRTLIDDIDEIESIDIDYNYKRTKARARILRTPWTMRLMRYAAILVLPLLFASGTLGYMYYKVISVPVQYAEVTAASGSVLRYELPDKSVVWLNSNSRLKYPVRFASDKREVLLDGEGYFQVTADKDHPFYVNTPNNLKVFVYGTHFDVNAYSDIPVIETVLEEGKVNVITPRNQMVQLLPGEALSYNKSTGEMTKRDVDVYEKTAWVQGKMVFRDATLEEILKTLSRHFNVKMNYRNHSRKTYHYHATFTTETLPQILYYLEQTATGLKWNIEEARQNDDSSFTQRIVNVALY